MKWTKDSGRRGAATVQGWPESVGRRLVTFAVVTLFVGTPLVSMMLFSEHTDTETIVVEPGSYYAMHFGFYGFGKLRYSCTGTGGTQTYLLWMDRINFDRLEDGKEYDYSGSEAVGAGGSGYGMMAGFMWEIFLVLVNDESLPATVEFEADSTAYFSLPAAMLLLGAVVTIGYAAHKRSEPWRAMEAARRSPRSVLHERRSVIVAIVGLVVLATALMVAIGRAIPADWSFGFNSALYRLWFGVLASTAIAFGLRLRLALVKERPDKVLAQLVRRLRVSGYRVSETPQQLSVQISSTSAIRIRAKPVPEGTLVSYSADATPAGWSIVVILLLMPMVAPFSMAISLFLLYRSAVFASDRVLPRLSLLPIPEGPDSGANARTLLIECLSEERRLSAEAYEAARSNYQDAILMLVVVSLALSAAVALSSGACLLQGFDAKSRVALSLLIAIVVGITASLVSWRLLAGRSKPSINELKAWTARLEVALSREVAQEQLPDGEPSSLELIVESYREILKWLIVRHKGGMFRDPGSWLLIFFFSYLAVALGLGGAVDLWRGQLYNASAFLGASAGFSSLAAFTYLRWRKHRRGEDERVVAGLANRIQTLKADMESYLRGV